MTHEDNWQKLQDWIVEKIKNCDGALVPMDIKNIHARPKPELDYQIFLENASRTMIRFRKPERLIRMIIRIIDEQVKVTHTAMLLRQEWSGEFVLLDSKGAEGIKIPAGFIRLASGDPLIRLFSEHHNRKISETGVIEYSALLDSLKTGDVAGRSKKLSELVGGAIKQMELLKANTCIPVFYKKELVGILVLGKKLSNIRFSRQEIGFFTTLANDVAMALSNARLIQDLQDKIQEVHNLYEREHNIFIHTSISLAAAIDARDPYTRGHTERVTRYSMEIANELTSIPDAEAYTNFKETLHVAALLHDVGKIGVPDGILNKESQLTDEEYEKVKEHPVTGAAILYPIKELGDIPVEVRAHHERFDGTGYPDGLKDGDIPFIARIISVADAFDAITSDRPYRRKRLAEIAAKIIQDNSGTQFDPIVVSAFQLAFKKGRLNFAV